MAWKRNKTYLCSHYCWKITKNRQQHLLKVNWFLEQDKILAHLVSAGRSCPPSPYPDLPLLPASQLLFLAPHLPVRADGYKELGQAGRSGCAVEKRCSRMSCWRQGDDPRFLSLPGSSTATAATLAPPSALGGKRPGKHLIENRSAEGRKQNKHGSGKRSLHLSSLCVWQIHTHLRWQLPATCRAPQPRGRGREDEVG